MFQEWTLVQTTTQKLSWEKITIKRWTWISYLCNWRVLDSASDIIFDVNISEISVEWFFYFCHSLCCFPSQPLPLPCHRPELVGLIAQGCPWSAGWSVRYWLLVFLKVVPAEVPWRAVIPDAGTSFWESSTSPEEVYTVDACETCCCWTCVSMQKCKKMKLLAGFIYTEQAASHTKNCAMPWCRMLLISAAETSSCFK